MLLAIVGTMLVGSLARVDAAAALTCTPASDLGAPPPSAPLPGSCFEGFDADQVDPDGTAPATRLDWQSIAPEANALVDDAAGAMDSQFGGGSSEETPDSWTFEFGSLGASKYDVLRGWSWMEMTDDDLLLALAFERKSNNGETLLAFELNQRQPGYRTAVETNTGRTIQVPTRTTGDLMITYSVSNNNASEPRVGLCLWLGDEHSGAWTDSAGTPIGNNDCPALDANLAQGHVNSTDIPAAQNFLAGTALPAGTFGEGVINLTDAFNGTGDDRCVAFGYLWMHTRSAPSVTSKQQDHLMPAGSARIGNCSVSGTKWQDVNGNGLRDGSDDGLGGWTIYVDYDNDSVHDAGEPSAVTAADGSYTIFEVADGTWNVREVAQPGWTCTSPSPCTQSIVMTGGRVQDIDFGNFEPNPDIEVVKTADVTQAGIGDTIGYGVEVTNPGDVKLSVTVSDPLCDTAPAGPVFTTGNSDAFLDPGETWSYSCSHVVTADDPDPLVNTVEVTGTDAFGGQDTDTSQASTDVLHPDIEVVKTADVTAAHVGDTITYALEVTNPGDARLDVTSVEDAQCDTGTLSGPVKTGGDDDAFLDPGEIWTWSCTHVVQADDADPFVNVVAVEGSDDSGGTDADTDSVSVDVWHPQIEVAKTADTALAHVGDTVTYTIDVTNPGDVKLTVAEVEDPQCDTGTLSGAVKTGGNDDEWLDPGEKWTWTCTHVVVEGDADPLVNHVDVVGADPSGDPAEGQDGDGADAVTDISHPQIAVEKTADTTTAAVGDTVTYRFDVTNPGDIKLTVTKFDDPRCDAETLSGPVKTAGNDDEWLDPGELWTWSCTHVIAQSDADPFVNHVIVEGTDPTGEVDEGQDESDSEAVVDVLRPGIEVDKKQRLGSSGTFVDTPVEAGVGETIEYEVAVANIGETPLTFEFADPGCDAGTIAGPARSGGDDDGDFEPGETWTYTCSHVITAADPDPYVNAVSITGVSAGGDGDADSDQVSAPIRPPEPATEETRTPLAPLPAPTPAEPQREVFSAPPPQPPQCAAKPFTLYIPGRGVRRVVFRVDGKRIVTVRKRDRKGRFPLRIDPKKFGAGTHRVSARLMKTNRRWRTVPMRSFEPCGLGKCVSRRAFRIRVKKPKGGDRVIRATVYVRDKRVKIIRGKRLRAPVVLNGLPIGRFKVRVISTLASGRRQIDIRTYHTCIKRLPRRPRK